jgi:hypothetical protein
MKYKLINTDFSNLKFNKGIENSLGKLINITYLNESFEFQTPKMTIHKIIKENGKEYIIFKIVNKSFQNKILELEKYLAGYLKKTTVSILNDLFIKLKVQIKYSKPIITIIYNNELFNYYHLVPGMEVICLVTLNTLWINDSINYNLTIKEILKLT